MACDPCQGSESVATEAVSHLGRAKGSPAAPRTQGPLPRCLAELGEVVITGSRPKFPRSMKTEKNRQIKDRVRGWKWQALRPGVWGGVEQPNPEIRDDSYLNNVGGMNLAAKRRG